MSAPDPPRLRKKRKRDRKKKREEEEEGILEDQWSENPIRNKGLFSLFPPSVALLSRKSLRKRREKRDMGEKSTGVPFSYSKGEKIGLLSPPPFCHILLHSPPSANIHSGAGRRKMENRKGRDSGGEGNSSMCAERYWSSPPPFVVRWPGR